jgi:hypothetical protein
VNTAIVALGYQDNWREILMTPFMRNALIGPGRRSIHRCPGLARR